MSWTEFHDRLRATLRALTDRSCLVVASPDDSGFLQFSVLDDVLCVEVSGRRFDASDGSDPAMAAAGWLPPTALHPQWSVVLSLPALTSEYADLAERCVVALRDVVGIEDPSVLSYRAWRDPDTQPSGVTWSPERVAALDRGENPLPLPHLGRVSQP